MKKYVKHIIFPEKVKWGGNHSNPFLLLGDLNDLRDVKVSPYALESPYSPQVEKFVADIKESIEKLKMAHVTDESSFNILELVQVVSFPCSACRENSAVYARTFGQCGGVCMRPEHRIQVARKFRTMLATAFKIELPKDDTLFEE